MRKRVLPKRLPIPQSMDAAEREYMRNLFMYQRSYASLLEAGLNEIIHGLKAEAAEEMPEEIRHDSLNSTFSAGDKTQKLGISHKAKHKIVSHPHFDANKEKEIRKLFASVQNKLKEKFPDKLLRKWSESMVSHVNDISKKNVKKVAEAVDLEIEPLMRDGELTPYFKNVVNENIGLIRSIPEEKMASFKNALVNAIINDHPQDRIRRMIEKDFNATRSRAALIARDQVNKLNGKISEYRQRQLGGERYKWRTSGDERVREDHAKLEGSIQFWNKPPITNKSTGARNHPGIDFQCRCTAEMILEDVLE